MVNVSSTSTTKAVLLCSFLVVQQSVKVDASRRLLSHELSRERFAHNSIGAPLPLVSPSHHAHYLLSMRGGASESASAWNAGSKYDYRTSLSSPSSSSTTTRNYQTPSFTQDQQDEKEATKDAFAEAFLRREDRNRFIARVYAILSGQLLFTAGAIHLFHLNPDVRDWMISHPAGNKVPLLGLLISTIAWFITLSSESIRQSSLMKWPLLLAFTTGQSIAVGFISSIYAYSSVIKAMVVTATTTLSVTLYTLLQKNPKYDLSQWGRALSGLGMAFLLYGMIHVLELCGVLPRGFLPYSEAMYSIFGAGLFSLYLAHHTRLIVSGKSAKYQMNEKDYILGAMSLYSDIVNIFLYLLR
eukprot:CAMPEP_0181088236 /NCGR_PEP_ID=MMETSP1071-20121207/6679_1 /TAXON_ID=35127 /ORGANISM="Thalassiosira sp., Strain NH16" /LENGTH=355 /DNA_ID=CAMNT_0023170139 /DNA_START=14 /DNA_END=1081 /DNA_ORIENTATION=-